MIKVSNLKKKFSNIQAVDGISFEIEPGETFGLLGPNGAGKSTAINIMSGILKPDEGEVFINGQSDPTRPKVRLQLGNAPQSLAIYDDLTAEENLGFFGKLYGLSGAKLKERVDWAIKFASLEDRRKDLTKTYSGGMKRRLNLACALTHEPMAILLDEPTVGVDPQSRNQIFDSIDQLKRDGRTIVYTTHYMEEASRLCDRVAIVDQGKLLAMDTVDGLIDSHGGLSVIEGDLSGTIENTVDIPGKIDGLNYRLETDSPMRQFQNIIERGVKFSRVSIIKADLESVFLNLTGRRLRD